MSPRRSSERLLFALASMLVLGLTMGILGPRVAARLPAMFGEAQQTHIPPATLAGPRTPS